ncbi:Variable small protein 58 (plasmid) [Borrelia hermsii]|nr:Vsp/OspC family lipoprotein [Borrelia hermsii]AMR76161.1 Variable small protein 58 [Borrelia hermsii]ANA43920.1 Vsp58 [Borrelia hermsii HS1]UPA08689.1 hypothetical protein bhDAH_001420 [Borrelia hermsii DAH]
MTLFMVFMSCNNGGPELKSDEVAKSDGTVLDLAKISAKIKEASDFATSVKEVHTLVKSIDELAKAIGKKIQNGDTLATDNNHNGGIIAGSFQMISTVKSKLDILAKTNELSDELNQKVNASKSKADAFLGKLKTNHTDLGKEGATDDHAKAALLITNNTKDKGASELEALNAAIDELLKAVNAAVEAAITELTAPVKAEKPFQNN